MLDLAVLAGAAFFAGMLNTIAGGGTFLPREEAEARALDPELVGEVLSVIRSLAHEHDLTMPLVTHEMRFAREISDHVCFFDGGRIIDQGIPDQIFKEPQQARTRSFLSSVLNGGVIP